MPDAPTTVTIRYMYRDASNYKNHEQSTFNPSGLTINEARRRIIATLDDQEYFIAAQVGLNDAFLYADEGHEYEPDAFLHARDGYQYDPDEDHPWHEFVSLDEGTEDITDQRSLEQLVEDFETAATTGWIPADPPYPPVDLTHEKGLTTKS